ncbi:unnamed protein product [Phytomonas sp. EM1]|nr:unnamed protein product [Phytomonas sp. EM1]|eukprot:CCW61243.1 unnamed protein product [Phytomonas sp. isolate EM1]
MYGELGAHTSRRQPPLQSSEQQTQLSITTLDISSSNDSSCTGPNRSHLPGNVAPVSTGASVIVSACTADANVSSNATGSIPICGAPVLGAVSLRYLSWYSAMIISQVFSREQLNAQKQEPYPQERHREHAGTNSACVEGYPSASGQGVLQTQDFLARRLRPTVLLSLPPFRAHSPGTPLAVTASECTSLIDTFEMYFFPHYLFQTSAGYCEAIYGSFGGVMATRYGGPMTTSTRLCTENELREIFQAFLKLGQQCAREAFDPPTADCPTSDDHRNVGRTGGSTRAGVGSSPDATVKQKASSACRAMRQFILSLAFNCPCAPLTYAAKLILADALSHADGYCAPREIFSRVSRGSTTRAHVMEIICFLSRLPVLPTSFSNATLPRRASASPQPPSSPALPNIGCTTGTDLRVKEASGHADVTENNPKSEVYVWEYHPLKFRSDDEIIWFDPHVRIQRLDEWLRGDQKAIRQDEVPKFVCARTPCAMVLPTIERVIMKDNGDGEEKVLLERVLRRIVAEMTSCRERDIHTSSMRTSRRRRQGGGSTEGTDTPSPRSGTSAGGSREIAFPQQSKNCREHAIDSGGGVSKEFQNIARQRQRQRQLLVALSHSHIFVPQSTSLLRNEILYSVFTETGDCPAYYHLLSLYPDLLRAHHASMRYVFFDDGPLPLDERLMLAIMVASRHQCEYLVCRYAALLMHYPQSAGLTVEAVKECCDDSRAEFFRSTDALAESSSTWGSEQWLLHGPPPRLRVVQHFIALAAHTPWLLSEDDVRAVLRAGWTVPEVFQLTAIISHVLSLSSFVQGLFVPTETWTWSMLPSEMLDDLQRHAEKVSTCHAALTNSCIPSFGESSESNEMIFTDSLACLAAATPAEERIHALRSMHDADSCIFRRYAGEADIVSKQRIRSTYNSDNLHTLRRSQFCWQDVGTTSMEHYYPGAAALLSEEIESFTDVVRQLTETDCASLKNLGFTPAYAFRSLQLYVINLLGFMLEDYPYNDINKVLRRPAKWYAQALTVRPEALTLEEVMLWRLSPQSGLRTSGPVGAESGKITLTGCYGWILPRASAAVIASQRMKQETDLLAAQCNHPTQPLELPLAWVHRSTCGNRELKGGDGSSVMSSATDPVDLQSQEEENAKALDIGLALQDERVLLLMAMATMMARKEALLHLLLHPLCAVLSKM